MATAFLDLRVQPVYGDFRALLVWTTIPDVAGGLFNIYKSFDGVNDWKLIATGAGIDSAIDTEFLSQGKLSEQYYKVTVDSSGVTYESAIVGTFGAVHREEFGGARMLMQQEYQIHRRFDSLVLCKLRIHAPVCHLCGDPETGQLSGLSLCPNCYATGKDGGFFPPVATYGRFMTTTSSIQKDSQDGTGTTDPSESVVRLVAYPLLRKTDMLVNKSADRRYLVEEADYTYFGGKIPVVAMVKVRLLNATDIRYKFPI